MDADARRAALAGLAALAVAVGIGRFAFTPILPIMLAEGNVDVVRGGWLASSNYAGYLAGGLTAMAWRWNARGGIRAGLVLVAVTTLAMALPLGIAAWLALRAAAGVASAWVLVFTSAVVLHRIDERAPPGHRGPLAGVLYAGVGTGVVVAGLACTAALGTPDPARAAWIVVGVIASAATAALWRRLPDIAAPAARARASGTWLTGRALVLAACYAAFGFGYIIPATFLSAMAREAARGGVAYSLTWPLFGLAAAASTVVVARRPGGSRPRATWVAGHAVMAAGVAIAAIGRGMAAVVACGLLVGATFMVVTMAGMQEARREAGAHARPMMALMTSAFAAGQIAGPLAVSALAASGRGYGVALWGAAAALAFTALVLHFFPGRPPS